MRHLHSIALSMNLSKGSCAMQLGYLLSKKENKTDDEAKVVKSYKTVQRNAVVMTLVCVAAIAAAVVFLLSSAEMSGFVKRYGTVEKNNDVRYVQSTMRYVALKDLGIDLETVKEGDKVILFFDRDDEITGAISQKAADKDSSMRMSVFLISFVGSVIILTVATVIMKRTVGKEWYEWLGDEEAIRASLQT